MTASPAAQVLRLGLPLLERSNIQSSWEGEVSELRTVRVRRVPPGALSACQFCHVVSGFYGRSEVAFLLFMLEIMLDRVPTAVLVER